MDHLNQVLGSILNSLSDEKNSIVRSTFVVMLTLFAARIIKDCIAYLYGFYRVLFGIFGPMNYEKDMTNENFCKYLAEVNNNLQIQTKRQCVTQINSADQSTVRSQNCVTSALTSDRDKVNANDPYDYSFVDNNQTSGKFDPRGRDSDHIYPNGWLPIMESTKVGVGEIKRAIFMGRDLIVTRSEEGTVDVLDAYCPHMGVHIGVGGRVLRVNDNSCVQCPFHGWTFRASDGKCVRIPYLKNDSKCNIPKQAQLKTWPACEIDNFIYVWHHIDNQPPSWHLEPTPELISGKFVLAGRSCHLTNLEMRDMHENGADLNHFEGIHNDLFVFGSNFVKVQAYSYLQQYTRHHWSSDWKPIYSDEGKLTHMAEMNLESWISLFKLRMFDIEVRATQIGPACVRLRYNSAWYGEGVLKMNAVPLGGRRTLYVQHMYTECSPISWILAKFVLVGEIMQLERDLFIWNHKKNIPSPIFVPEDKIIKRFRLWYSQFYKRKPKISIQDSSQPVDDVLLDNNRDLLKF